MIFNGGDNAELFKSRQTHSSLKDELSTLRGKKILLTEDNTTNQEIILGLLDGSGIEVEIAANGRQAVELKSAKDYDLILMDLQMPIWMATKLPHLFVKMILIFQS